jgi:4-hydroxy-2-oxoheptanedioate aldolase
MSTASPLVAETLAVSGVDAVVVDMQHGEATLSEVFALIATIELRGAEPFVRAPSLDASLIGRLLDMGATGIIVPMVGSAGDAKQLVRAVRYPPQGARSFGPRRPHLRFGADGVRGAAERAVCLAMIETEEGLTAAAEIAAVAGLDGIFVGPADLSMSLAGRAAEDPGAVERAVGSVLVAGRTAGCRTGIFCPSAEAAAARLAAGFDLVTIGSDLAAIERQVTLAIGALTAAVHRTQ